MPFNSVLSSPFRPVIGSGDAAGGGLVLPTANDRLAMWVSADTDGQGAGTIEAPGGAVSEWRDPRNPARKYVQGTGSLQPTTGAVTLNGKNVISASGGSLMVATGLTIDPTLPVYSFQVAKFGSDNDNSNDLAGAGGVRIGFIGRTVVRVTNTTAFSVRFDTPSTIAAVLLDYRHVNTLVASNTEFDFHQNGVQAPSFPKGVTSDAFTTQTLTTSYLFDDSSGGNALTGYVAENRIYNGTLTAGEITAIRAEMNATWSVY